METRATRPVVRARAVRAPDVRAPDVLAPVGLVVVGAVELVLQQGDGWGYGIVVEALAALLLVWRRTSPLVACTASAVVVLALPWVGPALDDVAAPILYLVLVCYSLARWLPDLRGLAGLGVLLLVTLVDYVGVDARTHDVTDVVFVLVISLPPFGFGRISRRLAEQSAQLVRQSEQLRDQAVRDERDRIARELHDVVAHSISAMVVQTAAAQDLLRTQPHQAARLLEAVAETGRQALAETGRLLHLVRDEADELGLAPAPGLAAVPDLVERFRGSGLAVEASLALPQEDVPAGVDVSAYRVVQEALTNALRHGDGPVRLAVDAVGDRLRITCSNPVGRAPAHGPGSGSGLGLQGMSERVDVLGGTLRHGPVGDRFEVDVLIPVTRP